MDKKNHDNICVAFSDESSYNDGRWRSIAIFSMHKKSVSIIRNTIRTILSDSDITEFKWNKLSSAKYKLGAEKIVNYIVMLCGQYDARLDVLVWDIQDARHLVKKRDDIANLGRMYFQLMKNVANKRWPTSMRWHFHPDEHSSMKWDTLADCVNHATRRSKIERGEKDLFTSYSAVYDFRIDLMIPRNSLQEPLIQVADLFAGIAVFSRCSFKSFNLWKTISSGQGDLFEDKGTGEFSKSDLNRFVILNGLIEKCNKIGSSVCLDSSFGLLTKNPRKPINFWQYMPQHPNDKAPIKKVIMQ